MRAVAMLTVAVLGPVEVRRDGDLVRVPSGKTTEVLVRLALDAGAPVRTDRLIDDLWSDHAATGRNTLQSKVSQLRKALGDPTRITSDHGGYTLAIDPNDVDALRVTALAATSSERRQAGDVEASLVAATEGLALFRGEVLADAGDGDWLRAHRVRLDELHFGLVEDQLAARVAQSSGADVIAELEALVSHHPLREGLWVLLITALYRSGRQADALTAFTRVRTILVDELGIEPGPDLQAVQLQVLEQSPELAPPSGPGITRPPVVTRPPPGPGNLPAPGSPLLGRSEVLADLTDRLQRQHEAQRLVTITGPGGVGKTRLAIEAARWAGGAGGSWLVRFDTAEATVPVTQVVAEALGVPGDGAALIDRLDAMETLLVLDNCEHRVDDIAALVEMLIDRTVRLRVLVTSQVPLGLEREAVVSLDPLAMEVSIALFAARAEETRASFVLDAATAPIVEEVCAALDGLPLAIELAAARVKSLSVRDIARRLDDRFVLLRDPNSHRPERRRALAAAIGWSYELLFPDDQRGLWAFACFAGNASLDAAERVITALQVPDAAALDVVSRLVDRSLVSVDADVDGTVRYRLLDSIRAYALDRLAESTEADTDAAFAAHAAWFAERADECRATVRGPDQARCVEIARVERANVDAALAWTAVHDPALGLRIANGFGWAWVVLGDGVAGASRVRAALDASNATTDLDVADAERLTARLLAGWLEASAGNVDRAAEDLDDARVLAEEADDERAMADVRQHQAFLHIQQGRPVDVIAAALTSLAVYERLGLAWEQATSLLLAAYGEMITGDLPASREAAARAVDLLDPIHDAWGEAHAQGILGVIAQADGRFDDAAHALDRAATASAELGFLGQAALHLTSLGRLQQRAGDLAMAADTLERAIAAAVTAGDARMAATARINRARVARADGDEALAQQLLDEADRWYRQSGGGDGALVARVLLAASVKAQGASGSGAAGRHAAGVSELEGVLDEARAADDSEVEVLTLDALARDAAHRGDHARADTLLAQADALMARVRHVMDEADRVDAAVARRSAHR